MSEPKWTPGPWQTVHSDPAEGADVWWLCAGGGNHEREFGSVSGGYPHERNEANARLIAAAPDLYDALEECAGHAGGDIGDIDWPMVRAALAKARGDTPC